MTITYVLHENYLMSDPGSAYRAVVQFKGTADMDRIIDRAMERGPAITREDFQAALLVYHSTIAALALEGYRVVTPIAQYGISIKGSFTGQTDGFSPARHSVEATVSPGADFRRIIREKAQVQQQEATRPQPNPLDYLDCSSGQRNSRLSPGRVAQLNGHRLKFDESDPAQGIFFISAYGVANRASLIVKNTPRQLIFETPGEMANGDYTVEIRSTYGNGAVRIGRLEATLTAS
jgi:hypothetical protein